MSLDEIRKRNTDGALDHLLKRLGSTSLGKTGNDDQEVTYYPERDKNGNGSCILRFLPGLESEGFPYFVERFQHGFQENGKWFIEFCPTTPSIDGNCPVCEDNREIVNSYGGWKKCPDAVQAMIRRRGRMNGFRAGFYCNVLVITDPANPENEGKVHLFKFGKGIMDMIIGMAQPEDDGFGNIPDPVNVFDLENGANFKFIIKKKDGRANYTKSEFESPSPCPEFDENEQVPLLPLVDPGLFKDYDTLKAKYMNVLGTKGSAPSSEPRQETPSLSTPRNDAGPEPDKTPAAESGAEFAEKVSDAGDAEDNLAYFQNLANSVDV